MATTFRPKNKAVENSFSRLQEEYADLTSRESYGKNATLNFAILLAEKYLEELNAEIDNLEDKKRQLVEAVT